jgi:hypothetical protein
MTSYQYRSSECFFRGLDGSNTLFTKPTHDLRVIDEVTQRTYIAFVSRLNSCFDRSADTCAIPGVLRYFQ